MILSDSLHSWLRYFFNVHDANESKYASSITESDGSTFDLAIEKFKWQAVRWLRRKHPLPIFLARAFVDDAVLEACRIQGVVHNKHDFITALKWLSIQNMTFFFACASCELELVTNAEIAQCAIRFHNAQNETFQFNAGHYLARRAIRQEVISGTVFISCVRLFTRSASLKEIARENKIPHAVLSRRLILSARILLRNYRSYLYTVER